MEYERLLTKISKVSLKILFLKCSGSLVMRLKTYENLVKKLWSLWTMYHKGLSC
jgi:hypothetical protein